MSEVTTLPEAILLVDRGSLVALFDGMADVSPMRFSVVCIDGRPKTRVAALCRELRAGWTAPLLYLHDASTVVYPFTIEPLATALAQGGSTRTKFLDLGLPPLGASARRFRDETLPEDELVREVAAIPPRALLRYCVEAARRLAAGPR